MDNQSDTIDPGMLEVSLALAGMIFVIAALVSTVPLPVMFLFVFLVILSNLTAAWFLARYCIQKNIISPPSIRPYILTEPIKLLLSPSAEMYWLLELTLLCLNVMFVLVIFYA